MEFADVVNGRKSIRKYKPDPVPISDILDIIRSGTRSANAGNKQSWRFFVVTNRSVIQEMRDAVDLEVKRLRSLAGEEVASDPLAIFFGEAPVVIAVASLPYRSVIDEAMTGAGIPEEERIRRRQRPDLQSVGGCVQLMLCAAYEKGYGGCWMTAPMVAREQIEGILKIEKPMELCAIVPIGKPGRNPPGTTRRPVEQMVTFIE
ncbi:MAG: nitroreductase family protein [Ignavibacteriales bacterium]